MEPPDSERSAGDPRALCEMAKAFSESGRWSDAIHSYELAARAGDEGAMLALAEIYDEGKTGQRDPTIALDWYKQYIPLAEAELTRMRAAAAAADADDIDTSIKRKISDNLGVLILTTVLRGIARKYLVGDGVPADPCQGLRWMERAAEYGDATAQLFVGHLTRQGSGTAPSPVEALSWFQRSASNGNREAQAIAGLMLLGGDGVAEDFPRAHRWLLLAAAQKDATAAFTLAEFYEGGSGVPADRGTALRFYETAADAGHQASREAIMRLRSPRHLTSRICDWAGCKAHLYTGESVLLLGSGVRTYLCPEHFPLVTDARLTGDAAAVTIKASRVYVMGLQRKLRNLTGWERMWVVVAVLLMIPAALTILALWPSAETVLVNPNSRFWAVAVGVIFWAGSAAAVAIGAIAVRWIFRGFRRPAA